jgi:arginine exporter protein ArgO
MCQLKHNSCVCVCVQNLFLINDCRMKILIIHSSDFEYDGFLIVCGTDTMAYLASALVRMKKCVFSLVVGCCCFYVRISIAQKMMTTKLLMMTHDACFCSGTHNTSGKNAHCSKLLQSNIYIYITYTNTYAYRVSCWRI